MAGWTDQDVAGYTRARGLEEHPWRAKGAETIGCVYCGGGGQFENSGYRLLRRTWPEAWERFVVGWRGGEIILAVKYDARLDEIQDAVKAAGGLRQLAGERPWVFDFLRRRPLKGRAM
jgi:3'-phosphoadenosine 5'-phosphosulfate sulfotransferase (PAPS reductase)/FAD synthetase